MQYFETYNSPLGDITLAADDIGLTGLWFVGQKHYARTLGKECEQRETEIISAARRWLDEYFCGKQPKTAVPLHLSGTDYQQEVWEILRQIPYGQTITYGDIAREIAKRHGKASISSQAVGNAVGRNPISIIVPCHRVIGANSNLTGYAGGIDRKKTLLRMEGIVI